jgi:predicted Rossmann-fold nucleotide-binding protein
MKYRSIKSQQELVEVLKIHGTLRFYAFQNLDIISAEKSAEKRKFVDCMFLGCNLDEHVMEDFENCLIFPRMELPYNIFANTLYTHQTLFGEYQIGKPETYAQTFDQLVYRYYLQKGELPDDIAETLARSIHDHSMSDALADFLKRYNEKKVVGIMGGHGILRTDNSFLEVAKISKKLTEMDYLMVSGGGPGAMEATHLGAWMAGRPERELMHAVKILSEAPEYRNSNWIDRALQVIKRYPLETAYKSVGIPTWHYGHEPTTPFATHIAKYFANSIREDGILTIAKGGIIYTPGSAGTMQEIFQEATQNHYLSFGYASPMAFYNKKYWTEEYPAYTLLSNLQAEGKYRNLILSVSDTIDELIAAILKFTEK